MLANITLPGNKRLITKGSLHIAFGACLVAIYIISYNRLDNSNAWIFVLKDILAVASIFYGTSYFAIPRWLMKGKYSMCLVWLLVIYVWWAVLTYYTCYFVHMYMEPSDRLAMYTSMVLDKGLKGLFNFKEIPFYLLDFIYLVSLPLGVRITQALLDVRNQQAKLEIKNMRLALNNVELELAFLKSQINPHFLFNTLNNIYILVENNNPKGAQSIIQLSSIMNYLLHESNQETVPLSVEYSFLKSYIDLEKLRISDQVDIQISMDSDNNSYSIVPLIIFPFVENAFKHGPKSSNKNAWVNIQIKTLQGKFQMEVANAFSPAPKPPGYVGGIGLENVRKRLDLNYKDAYALQIQENEHQYSTILTINLFEGNH